MPEPLAPGTGSARLTGSFFYHPGWPVGGEVRGEIGLTDLVTAELGLTSAFTQLATFMLGGGGLRVHPIDHEWLRLGISVSLGFGAGSVGPWPNERWNELRAFSIALGVDLGVRCADWVWSHLGCPLR